MGPTPWQSRTPPRYLLVEPDRFGNVRYYAYVKHKRKIRLRSPPNTPAFHTEHAAAIAALMSEKPVDPNPVKASSFKALTIEYMGSPAYGRLDPKTQQWQRRSLEWVCEKAGDLPFAQMEPRHVRKLRNELQSVPAASRTMLKALRAMFRWAIELDKVRSNPTIGVEPIAYVVGGHPPWTIADREAFKARHPLGTPARLAYALTFYSMGRREDVARLGPKHLHRTSDGRLRLRFRYAKNEHRNPMDADLPVHPDLAEAIEAARIPPGQETFIVSALGTSFHPNGLYKWFKAQCKIAGLPQHCSIHGLRKSALAAIAEDGASTHELAAGGGHRTLAQVENYSRSANRAKLADMAIARLK